VFCPNCGAVIRQSEVREVSEWMGPPDMPESRLVSPISAYVWQGRGMPTEISWKDVKQIKDHERRAQYQRLVKWQQRIRQSSAPERNVYNVLTLLKTACNRLGLSADVLEEAAYILRKVANRRLTRSGSPQAVAGAVLYAACRQHNIPKTLQEISDAVSESRKEVGRAYRYIVRELGLQLPPPDPQQYIVRLCTALELDGRVQDLAIRILDEARFLKLTSGRGPTGMAAAVVYIAIVAYSLKGPTQREIASTAGVTEVTIRNRYKEILENVDVTIYV